MCLQLPAKLGMCSLCYTTLTVWKTKVLQGETPPFISVGVLFYIQNVWFFFQKLSIWDWIALRYNLQAYNTTKFAKLFRTLIKFMQLKKMALLHSFKMMQIFLQLYCGAELDFL